MNDDLVTIRLHRRIVDGMAAFWCSRPAEVRELIERACTEWMDRADAILYDEQPAAGATTTTGEGGGVSDER